MKVVVTGAAGLTAGEVARRLTEQGATVVGVVRRPEQRDTLPGARLVVGDVADAALMGSLLEECDALVHVAGIHLAPALAHVPALRRVPRLVAVSSATVRSAHHASARVYRESEETVRAIRPDAIIVRPTMIYGSARDRNVQHVIRFARRFRFLPLVGDGRALLQPIHYVDLAAALVALIGARAERPVDAGGAAPVTVREAGEIIFAALDLPPRFLRLPLGPALALAGATDRLTRSRWRERIARTQEDRGVDNSDLIALTGVRPRSFSKGVGEEVRELGG